MVKTLKKSNREYADKLDAVQARFEGIREELKTTAAHTWTVTLEWLLLTNMEIKTANIFDDILKAKPGNESSEHTMTVDSVMAEWGDAIKGWQDGVEYKPGIEDDEQDMGEVSDGNHTFNELYMHRTTLFNIILCQNKDKAWKSKLHDDGTMFDLGNKKGGWLKWTLPESRRQGINTINLSANVTGPERALILEVLN